VRLFYDSTIAIDAKQHILSEEESKHACRVLRMQVGDELAIVNGLGSEFTGNFGLD
jgi:16S rRNA (uracil1498-N3)-methyltransferase